MIEQLANQETTKTRGDQAGAPWQKQFVGMLLIAAVITGASSYFVARSIAGQNLAEPATQAKTAKIDNRPVLVGVPIGTIVAWHETMQGTPKTLPGWVRCNGQMLEGDEYKNSPYYRRKLPDLNGERRFLRGGSRSGDPQDASAIPVFSEYSEGAVFIGNSDMTTTPYSDVDGQIPSSPPGRRSIVISPNQSTDPRTFAVRVRPINMSVVWIIRVK